jgi:hypothetical protein
VHFEEQPVDAAGNRGAGDELQVSLNVNSTGFKVANDVAVAAKVLAPERGCSCEQDSPQ